MLEEMNFGEGYDDKEMEKKFVVYIYQNEEDDSGWEMVSYVEE